MGYYTKFKLTINEGRTIQVEVRDTVYAYINEYCGVYLETHCFSDDYKWYAHEEDMLNVSLQFPDLGFTLSGLGEDQTGLWVNHYKNGKSESATIETVVSPPTIF